MLFCSHTANFCNSYLYDFKCLTYSIVICPSQCNYQSTFINIDNNIDSVNVTFALISMMLNTFIMLHKQYLISVSTVTSWLTFEL